jgi:predicted MPP superfamily phosphohydrolase
MSMHEGAVLFLAAALIFLVLSCEARWFFSFLHGRQMPRSRAAVIVHSLFFSGLLLLVYAFWVEPYWLQVEHITIRTPKLRQTGFTLVHLSDLHCDVRRRNEEKIVRLVNAIRPDAVLFTGDSVNTPEALPLFQATLNRLNARLGKFAVKGNWDARYWKGMDIFKGSGFRSLSGAREVLSKEGEEITVTGYDPDQAVPSQAPQQTRPGAFSVFLFHYPGIHEEIGADAADLFLSGHTHGGQVALPFYGALITLSRYGKKYEAGLYQLEDNSLLYVSRGVGMEGGFAPRVRFFSRPQITVFHIFPQEK